MIGLGQQKNSRKQGDVGLGYAIGWFSKHGHCVAIPLTDSQDYDLLVDDGKQILKVQVKTTRYKVRNKFVVQLEVKGGNRSGTGKTKKFNRSRVDLLFVLTEEGEGYAIPAREIEAKSALTLGEKYQKYKTE